MLNTKRLFVALSRRPPVFPPSHYLTVSALAILSIYAQRTKFSQSARDFRVRASSRHQMALPVVGAAVAWRPLSARSFVRSLGRYPEVPSKVSAGAGNLKARPRCQLPSPWQGHFRWRKRRSVSADRTRTESKLWHAPPLPPAFAYWKSARTLRRHTETDKRGGNIRAGRTRRGQLGPPSSPNFHH